MKKCGRAISDCVCFVLLMAMSALVMGAAHGVTNSEDVLDVGPGESIELHGVHYYRQRVTIHDGGTVFVTTHDGGDNDTGTLTLIAPVIEILEGGRIDGVGRGYAGGAANAGNGAGPGGGRGGRSNTNNSSDGGSGGGGGYGGGGGGGQNGSGTAGMGGAGGAAYDAATSFTVLRGSGGGAGGRGDNYSGRNGSRGGAAVSVLTGRLVLDGVIDVSGISATGRNGSGFGRGGGGGAGSGGGILVLAANPSSVAGQLRARGGAASSGGGGGGGRIKTDFPVTVDISSGDPEHSRTGDEGTVYTALGYFNGSAIPDAFEYFNGSAIPDFFEDTTGSGIPDWFESRRGLWSTTHPHGVYWYNNGNFAARWAPEWFPDNVGGWYYTLDSNASTKVNVYDHSHASLATLSYTQGGFDDGVRYFHLVPYNNTNGDIMSEWQHTIAFRVNAQFPDISSATHPDQNMFYNPPNVQLAWSMPAGLESAGQRWYYAWNRSPNYVPTREDAHTESQSVAFVDGAQYGTYYFHLVGEDGMGNLSPVRHFRVNIQEITGPATGNPDTALPPPAHVTPAHTAEGVDGLPVLEVTGFSDPTDGTATRALTQWQLWEQGGASHTPLWSGESDADSIQTDIPLQSGVSYHWRSRFESSSGYWTEWSSPTLFTVAGEMAAPTADFSASPATGSPSFIAAFTDTSAGLVDTWAWDLTGDGVIDSRLAAPVYLYSLPGHYDVTLTVSGPGGSDTVTMTAYIHVDTLPVEASFTVAPKTGIGALEAFFTNTSSGTFGSVAWNFGDGATSDDLNPIHTYTEPGVYTVSLTVSGFGGEDTATTDITVYAPASADFSATATSGPASLEVTFTNESTGDFDTVAWDFGDGATSDNPKPMHTYTEPGIYTVTLTVSGDGGEDVLAREDYIVVYTPVAAAFGADVTSAIDSLTVSFTNESTGDFDTVAWDFGDGATSDDLNPIHTYTEPGIYTVTLTVSGDGGEDVITREDYIAVYTPVAAAFSADVTSGIDSLTVTFTNESTGDFNAVSWDFGDGATSDDPDPMHTYTQSGIYMVTLTVSGDGGEDVITREDYIAVYTPVAAAFNAAPTSGPGPLTVQFTDVSTGDIDAWSWNFDDGGTSSAQNPNHTFMGGEHTVVLTVSGPGGEDTAQTVISVENGPPVAQLAQTVIQLSNLASAAVLDASGSSDPDGDPLYYSWREHPDNPVLGLLPIQSEHMARLTLYFPEPGLYVFDLVVSDGRSTSLETGGNAPLSVNVEVPGLTGYAYALPTWGDVRVPDTMVAAFTTQSDLTNWQNPFSLMIADSQGRYRLENLTAAQGQWWLGWSRAGFIQASESVPGGNSMQPEHLGMRRGVLNQLEGAITTQTGEPLRDVRVSLIYGADVAPISHDTNSEGQFAMADVPLGNWQLQLYKLGYRAEVRDISIVQGMAPLQLSMHEDAGTGNLSGRILLQGTATPVPNALISLGNMYHVEADPYDGYYFFDRVPVGDYVVTIQAEGYAPYRDYFVRVLQGETERDFTLNFDGHGPMLRGYVRDSATGAPVFGATVGIEGPGYLTRSALTDHSGWYTLYDVPHGDQQFVVRAAGYNTYTAPLFVDAAVINRTVSLMRNGGALPRPPSNGPVATLSASATHLSSVGGTVTLTAGPTGPDTFYSWRENPGNPLLGRLYANMQTQPTISTRELDVPGTYVFDVQVRQGGVLSANSASVTVVVPGLRGQVSMSPSDGVMSQPGIPVSAFPDYASALSFVDGQNPTPLAQVNSGDDGRYLFRTLSANDTVWIAARDNAGVFASYGPVSRVVNASPYLNNNEINMVKDSYTISGTIATDSEPPLPLENVRVIVAPGIIAQRFQTTTDRNGHYKLTEVPAGSWTMLLIKDDYETISRQENFNSNRDNLNFYMFEGSGALHTLTGTTERRFRGVTFPVPHVEIVLANGLFRGFSDMNGNFSIPSIPAGLYEGVAIKDGYRFERLLNIEVYGGASSLHVRMNFEGHGPVVMGHARDENGLPIQGANIVIRSPETAKGLDEPITTTPILTDETGYFVLEGVPHGPKHYEMIMPDGTQRETVVNVSGHTMLAFDGTGINVGGEGEGAAASSEHTADQNGDGIVSLSELLRVIQFFNTGGLHCANPPGSTEDGYAPGTNAAQQDCAPHASDYNPQDWVISLSELLRLIQFFNTGGYHPCPDANTEDGYCPGQP